MLHIMDLIKERGSTTKPPLLNGTNYAYWTACIAFLKSIDSKIWNVVVTG